jgi:endonuclease/exonuclease/phosphatase (EEP) superfamily protein YafD
VAILLTLLPLVETDTWWVRLWDYPRLQIGGALLLGLVGLLVTPPRSGTLFWAAAGAGLAAFGWQASEVLPYLPGYPRQVADAATCAPQDRQRLLNANVLLDNRRFGSLLTQVRRNDPDVILLLEPGPEWAEAMRPLFAQYPFRFGEPVPNTYGMLLLSRLPLEKAVVLHRLQAGVPSIRTDLRMRSGALVTLHGVHPEPPLPGDDSGERDAELVMVGREIRAAGGATLVLGDLNDVAWSHTSRLFRRLAGMRDPRVGRGPYPTFPVAFPWLRWPLDHVFVTPHWRLNAMKRLPDIGSDHFPMLFDLCLTKPAEARLSPTMAPADVREDAKDQLKEGLEERRDEATS